MPPGASVSRVITKEELCLMEQIPQPCGIVIFGASGDLTHRKLIPALLTLLKEKVMPKDFYVLGVARTAMTDEAFRKGLKEALSEATLKPLLEPFIPHCYYLAGAYDDPKTYAALSQRLSALDQKHMAGGRRLFYLSTPPALYETIAKELGAAHLAQEQTSHDRSRQNENSWVRLVVEKPFGSSRPSADALNRALHRVFRERQIYRIDHYLGKETVQNILMFRFANAIYEPVWNHNYIDHVQITAAETVGVEHRAGYYEGAGALRDMFQNHLFQLLSLVAMEPPSSFEADAVRDEKNKVLASLCTLDCGRNPSWAIRGQYEGYRKEHGVAASSTTETFAALRAEVENWRWHGVPFYLRSGKRMAARATEIAIQFKHVPTSIFKPLMADQMSANLLRFRIQPNEGISLQFEAKHPGPKLCMASVTMEFDYDQSFGVPPPEAYARLFLDIMLGDQTLFARQDWLACSWDYLDPILAFWNEKKEQGLLPYPPGSWGPQAAEDLLEKDGRAWLTTS